MYVGRLLKSPKSGVTGNLISKHMTTVLFFWVKTYEEMLDGFGLSSPYANLHTVNDFRPRGSVALVDLGVGVPKRGRPHMFTWCI